MVQRRLYRARTRPARSPAPPAPAPARGPGRDRAGRLGATLGANYDCNTNLRLTANTGFNATSSAGSDATSLGASVGASYQGIPWPWAALAMTGSPAERWDSPPPRAIASTASSRPLSPAARPHAEPGLGTGALSTVTIAGQTLSYTQIATSRDLRTEDLGAGTGDVTALLNTLSGTWATGGSDRNAYARATYSDPWPCRGRTTGSSSSISSFPEASSSTTVAPDGRLHLAADTAGERRASTGSPAWATPATTPGARAAKSSTATSACGACRGCGSSRA